MRTWALRHPSAVVLALVAVWLVNCWAIGDEVRHHRWIFLVCQLFLGCYLIDRIRDWWKRR